MFRNDNDNKTNSKVPIYNLHKRGKGNIGENVACDFIKGQGFLVVDRNYQKSWGELDIVAIKDEVIHFFEVKSVTGGCFGPHDAHSPEDNVHGLKVCRIRRMVQTYLEDKKRGLDADFRFHILCVFMNMKTRKAKVKWIKDLVL